MAVGGGGATAFSFFFSFLFPSFSAHSCALPRIPSYEEMWKKRETNVWAAGVNVHLKKRGEREKKGGFAPANSKQPAAKKKIK